MIRSLTPNTSRNYTTRGDVTVGCEGPAQRGVEADRWPATLPGLLLGSPGSRIPHKSGTEPGRFNEQHDEWAGARRYLGLDALAKARLTLITDPEEDPTPSQPCRPDPDRGITPTPNTTPQDLTQ